MKNNKYNLYGEIAQFIEKLNSEDHKPIYDLTFDEAKNFLKTIQEKDYKNIPAEICDTEIVTPLEGNVSLRFVRPNNTMDIKLPLIIYAHGGGWVMGDETTHDELIKKLAINTNCAVAFVKYPHSPQAAFPVAFNQIYATLDFLYNNPDDYNIDSNKIILAGDSAGANMISAAAIRAKEEKGPDILLQILLYPALSYEMDTKSYKKFKDGPWLTKKAMEWFWNAYIQDKEQIKNYYAQPLIAPNDVLNGLPKTLIITAENDVLRNEGEDFADKLNNANVDVACVRIIGAIHDFMMLNAISDTKPAKTAFNIVYSAIKDVLN